jgi:hypothetical protein
MRNPFGKPRTLWHWWLGSLCWTVAAVASWLLLNGALLAIHAKLGTQQQQDEWLIGGAMNSFGVAQVLLLGAVCRQPTIYPATGRINWPVLLMLGWLTVLGTLEIAWLGVAIIMLCDTVSAASYPTFSY